MTERNIHLTNSNVLTHHWDPENTQETLAINQKIISVVPNAKQSGYWPRELHVAAATMHELKILIEHARAMIDVGTILHKETKELPSTNLTQYHEKISAYQGMINLFFKHHKFLINTTKILSLKFQDEIRSLFFNAADKMMFDFFLEHSKNRNSVINDELLKEFILPDTSKELLNIFLDAKRENNDVLIQLMNAMRDMRECQKKNALSREFFVASEQRISEQSQNVITRITQVREPQEFVIGSYSHRNQHYSISVNMAINNQYDWNEWLTKNPLGNLVFKSRCTDCTQVYAGIEATVTWPQRDYPVLYRGTDNTLEPTAIGVNYAKLFAANISQIPCVEPTLFIQKEIFIENNHVHMSRLYQALAEWMQYYHFDQMIFYGTENDAPYLYTFGFTTTNDVLSKKTECLLLEALENGVPYRRAESAVEKRYLPRIPFVLKTNEFCTAKTYHFESKNVMSCAELMLKAHVLKKDILPAIPPMMSGVSYLPYKNAMTMLHQREMLRPGKKNPVGIRAVLVDYHALKHPIERIAYAQVGDADLEQTKIKLDHKKALNVKRF